MAWRLRRENVWAGAVLALALSGCDVDESGNGGDAGADGDEADGDEQPEEDAGQPGEDAGELASCAPCEDNVLRTGTMEACCLPEDQSVCGLKVDTLPSITGCLQRDALPDAPASDHCGAFFDQIDADETSDGRYTVYSEQTERFLSFGACCTPQGECGVVFDTPAEFNINLHLGCVSVSVLLSHLKDPSSGPDVSELELLPYCDPGKEGAPAACPAKLNEQACAPLLAANIPCTPGQDTPRWVCQQLELPVIGEDAPPVEDCMAGVPEYAHGCGEDTSGNDCVPNMPVATFGCEDVPAGTPALGGIPAFVCGCGEGELTGDTDFPCLPNVVETVCGKEAPSADELMQIPEFICGCGPDTRYVPGGGLPCLSNVATDVCGTKPIDAESDELGEVPEFICGCDGDPFARALCMKGVAVTVCGELPTEVDEENDCLVGLPEYARGCGDGLEPSAQNPSCLRHADALFGCVEIPSGAPDIAGVPAFVCGCGDDTADPGGPVPCLNGVPKDVCGAAAPTPTQLGLFPEFTCGCGVGELSPATGLPCINNVAETVCGSLPIDAESPYLGAVPEFVCGCGEGTMDPHTGLPCLSNVDVEVCGADLVESADDENLDNVPEYLCGCGEGETESATGLPCLANVHAGFCGDLDVPGGTVAGYPEWVCGCGDNTRFTGAGLPCLDNIPKSSCGTENIPAEQALEALPEYMCGCGEGVVDPGTAFPCLSNVDSAFCGGEAVTSAPANVPEYLCGCGEDQMQSATGLACLKNVTSAVCGASPIPGGVQLPGYPEFICGCGDGTRFNGTTFICLDNIPGNTCGAVNVTELNAPVLLEKVPEYLCGCGDGVLDPGTGLPCLDNVALDLCGQTEVTAGPIAGYPNAVCGCGDNELSEEDEMCIDNVPEGICGDRAMCGPVGQQGTCSAGQVCVDVNNNGLGDICMAPPG